MKTQVLSGCLLFIIIVSSVVHAITNPDRFLGPRDIRGIKSTIGDYIKYDDSMFRYGNWYGPRWWGGATAATPGNNPPVDSLDTLAQRHDFAYQVAEQQGKIYGIAEEKRLKDISDYLAVRDAKALSENPNKWSQPPADVNKASLYRDRMMIGGSCEPPAYQGVSVIEKEYDWVTSSIENWRTNKSNHLALADLEKQVTSLQNEWSSKNLTPISNPNSKQTEQK
jgi:hypothetical protein